MSLSGYAASSELFLAAINSDFATERKNMEKKDVKIATKNPKKVLKGSTKLGDTKLMFSIGSQ